MKKNSPDVERIMNERFGRDTVIALATVENGVPSVRFVDAWYESGAFYSITHGLSNKMRQIAEKPTVAIAGEWFTAHGIAENLGYFGKRENQGIAQKLQTAFAAWIDNGHNDFTDENTVILRVKLTDGVVFSNGTQYEL